MDTRYTLQTVERAIAFLEYVATAATPPSVRDASRDLKLNITTCYHLLRTLTALDYVKRRDDGGLELGDRVSIIARNFRKTKSLEQDLADIVHVMAASTMETSFLSLRDGDSVVLKVLAEGSQRLRVAGLYVGLKGEEFRRASGKAVLAFLKDDERQAMLEASLAGLPDARRKATLKTLEKELPLIRSRGWSLDEGESEDGITAIGAPIFDATGTVFGAVGVIVPTFRLDRARDGFMNAVLEAAADATRRLKDAELA